MKFDSRHLSSTPRSVAMAVLVLATVAPATWTQKDMGNIVGSVNDRTGAVVADAKVTITDVDHGTVFNTTTNSSGEYVAGPLKIGRYKVTVEKTGFKTHLRAIWFRARMGTKDATSRTVLVTRPGTCRC